ncbi:MAG TPA: UDP-N-acetylmuramate dehydrogenase [Gammaproteobacteria bacterium]|nr:UDP-N-acetylmuramate dehydrogenase [Gammaproteobacteria bacterium]
MTARYILTANASLEHRNTFRVSAHAKWMAEIHAPAAIPEVLALPQVKDLPLLVLGEGSNTLFTRDFDGLILLMANRGMELLADNGSGVRVRAAAAEHWHELVRWSLAQGLCGLENLSLIPGTVGAAPIQNIGAYGAELSETLISVSAYDRMSHEQVQLSWEQCGFSYRDSIFKRTPERSIITTIELRLQRSAPLKLDYAGVREELAAMHITEPTAADVSVAVCRLRLRKLPDPAVIGNAGSFFKNPLVPESQAAQLQKKFPDLPAFQAPQGRKLSAAWMIEHCGWKGFREGDAGVSDKHALVLVNYMHASGTQILALARRIQESVQQKFGIRLEPEPNII